MVIRIKSLSRLEYNTGYYTVFFQWHRQMSDRYRTEKYVSVSEIPIGIMDAFKEGKSWFNITFDEKYNIIEWELL